MDIDLSNITSFLAMLASLVAVWMAWRKAPSEMRVNDAESALKYGQMAELAAERTMKLTQRVDALECEVDKLNRAVAERDRLIGEWQHGIDRLVMQLGSLGVNPVWKPKKPDWLKKEESESR